MAVFELQGVEGVGGLFFSGETLLGVGMCVLRVPGWLFYSSVQEAYPLEIYLVPRAVRDLRNHGNGL